MAEGDIVHVGDFIPYWNVKLASGGRLSTLAYTSHLEDARRALSASQPGVAAALKSATLYNRATYACSAITMDRWDLPGASPLAEPVPASATASREPG